ncbi:hypothetical protein C7399_112113 [Paraburkholderia tropica]|uniref:Uncharacterized protein n=1 Tax=Paraburkholderia tropica TaxID=92647 RepID=A0ABX5MMX6_9BURK|nr:hypothetical protein [Paraburkholderia tropica]PXX14503.1 hypothetical protein C7400_112114 [Paraburkholderia tropica]PZW79568.1 hypothetical protein C7399_112113 [Paraburkholderia tropica]
MEWSTACPDWPERLRSGRSIIPPPIFPEQAELALNVFKQLKIVDAPGSPTFGEASAQWVFDLVASIFGAYDANSGRRLITEWFVCIPKKNSETRFREIRCCSRRYAVRQKLSGKSTLWRRFDVRGSSMGSPYSAP